MLKSGLPNKPAIKRKGPMQRSAPDRGFPALFNFFLKNFANRSMLMKGPDTLYAREEVSHAGIDKEVCWDKAERHLGAFKGIYGIIEREKPVLLVTLEANMDFS